MVYGADLHTRERKPRDLGFGDVVAGGSISGGIRPP
jgi:hypothetical protein